MKAFKQVCYCSIDIWIYPSAITMKLSVVIVFTEEMYSALIRISMFDTYLDLLLISRLVLSHFAILHVGGYRKFRPFVISRGRKSNRCLIRTYLACRLHFSRMHDVAAISHDTMENRIVTFDGKICVPPVVPIIEYTLDWSCIIFQLRIEKHDKLLKGDSKPVDRLTIRPGWG